jgi:hypothetical protein
MLYCIEYSIDCIGIKYGTYWNHILLAYIGDGLVWGTCIDFRMIFRRIVLREHMGKKPIWEAVNYPYGKMLLRSIVWAVLEN